MSERPSEVGGYRLLRHLGRGGFGSVYLGESPQGRRAAVKLLHVGPEGDDAEFREQLAREVDSARKVPPFCIAAVLDADPQAAQPWIATEYVEGPTLAQEVRDNGPRSGPALHRLAVSTATALTAVHRAGVVHRDFKPENIIIAAEGPRVIDFGIARAFEATAVTASRMIGTPAYMAPEQMEEGARLTPSVDIHAWGAVMVFAATGRSAFPGSTHGAMLRAILLDQPDLSGVPEALQAVVRRCTAKDPARRPTAHQVLGILLGEEAPDPERAVAAAADSGSAVVSEAEWRAPGPGTRSAPGGSAAPPFEFAGISHRAPGSLAGAMQGDWPRARRVFTEETRRASLAAWLIEDCGDTVVERGLLRTPPDDPDLVVAKFIAQLRPDLPPVWKGLRLSLEDLGAAVPPGQDDGLWEALGAAGVSLAAVEVLARHRCAAPDHPCPPDEPCARYRDLAVRLRQELSVYQCEWRGYAAVLAQHFGSVLDVAFSEPAEGEVERNVMSALMHPQWWSDTAGELRAELPRPWAAGLPATPDQPGARVAHRRWGDSLAATAEYEARLRSEIGQGRTFLAEVRRRKRRAPVWGWGSIGVTLIFFLLMVSGWRQGEWGQFWLNLVLTVVAVALAVFGTAGFAVSADEYAAQEDSEERPPWMSVGEAAPPLARQLEEREAALRTVEHGRMTIARALADGTAGATEGTTGTRPG